MSYFHCVSFLDQVLWPKKRILTNLYQKVFVISNTTSEDEQQYEEEDEDDDGDLTSFDLATGE